jgi:hypothetical protein
MRSSRAEETDTPPSTRQFARFVSGHAFKRAPNRAFLTLPLGAGGAIRTCSTRVYAARARRRAA